jgi:predicted Zn-dependent protease
MSVLTARRTDRGWRPIAASWPAIFLAAFLCGCAGWPALKLPVPDVAPIREKRRSEVVEEFETRRDQAQFSAAMSRLRQGDRKGGQGQLLELVERNPCHREARFALADLYLGENDPAAAQRQMRSLLSRAPADAEAHFVLGLILASSGGFEEAEGHLRRAAELEPDNELYAGGMPPRPW